MRRWGGESCGHEVRNVDARGRVATRAVRRLLARSVSVQLATLASLQLAFLPPVLTAQPRSPEPPDSLAQVVVRAGAGARVDSLLDRYAEYGFSGTVLVVRRGEVLLSRGYGLADRERGEANAPATLFDFASITKTVTGAAALKLEALGKLSTSDSLTRFLGPVEPRKRGALVRHLALHTSGYVARGTDIGDDDRRGFMEKMRVTPAEAVAGAEYRYSNAGSSLLAAIVEEVSGVPYEDFVREQLFAPAGIRGGFRWEAAWNARRARGYAGRLGEPVTEAIEIPIEWGLRGATGWIGTVGDVYRFHHALFGGTLLPPVQRAKLLDSTVDEAYGWHYEPRGHRGRAVVHKGGDFPGAQSQLLHFPDEEVTIVWANNDQRQRWRDLLNQGISRLALGEGDVAIPPPIAAMPQRSLASLAGEYADAQGRRFEIRAADGYLFIASGDSVPLTARYHPTPGGAFVALPPRGLIPLTLTFELAPSGATRAARWTDGRATREWRR